MFANVLCLIAAYTVTKTVRDAVLLSKFGLTELSYVMIGIAVAAGFVVSLFTRTTAGVARDKLIIGTNAVIAVTLVAMAPALRAGWGWLAWALYFWSGVFGLIVVAEFWLLANDLFHAREARRLFPLIGAGAILGGVVGGVLSGWLAKPLGTANLLYIVAALLVLGGGISRLAWRRRPAERRAEPRRTVHPRLAEGFALLRSNRYVRLIALMMVCMTLCMTLVQWQYKGIAKAHFGSRRDEMAAFFGTLAAILNAASFVVQMLVTPRLLGRFGVRTGLRVLPVGFLVGGVLLMTVAPLGGGTELMAAVVAVLLSDGLRFSVDKASVELLYLPIPRAIKDQAKPFVDTVVDRAAGALAGFLWLFLTWAFHVNDPARIGWASAVTLALVGVWLVVIARARRGYVDAYRRMLSPARAAPPPHPRAAELAALLDVARDAAEPPVRTRALRAVGRLVRGEPPPRLAPGDVEPLLAIEAEELALLARAVHVLGAAPLAHAAPSSSSSSRADGGRQRPRPLLTRVVEERFVRALERVARLLALVYPPRDIAAAHRALASSSPGARAGALELLDNVLEAECKGELLQAIDDVLLGAAATLTRASTSDREAVLDELARSDAWLRACVAYDRDRRAGLALDEERAAAAGEEPCAALEPEESRC
jgi:ATP/ADP translocase